MGGGQLARMMAPAAVALGFHLHVLAEAADVSAVDAVANAPVGDYRDLDTLRDFAQPRPDALVNAQDKLVMRAAIERLGLPNPAWAAVASVADIAAFGEDNGWPVVLKMPRGGYDGKGVRVLANAEEAAGAAGWFEAMSPLLVEERVDFSRELSALVARTPSGEAKAWPVVESIQVAGVCDEVIAPAPDLPAAVEADAEAAALRIAETLGVTGVMAAELFETPGRAPGYLINELAMRPHNTGHWTMDGAVTGQFEQHLRAVLDLPLGATDALGDIVVMKNFLGGDNHDLYGAYRQALSAGPTVKVHSYGKSVRPGRKIGHVNVIGSADDDVAAVRARAATVANIIRDGH